ncbi:MAG: hypothetical protein CSA66_04590 [Proteobacteria bacterium]|nr:MAG: hypothetical protein CSA66_04590 [Pseudomonadota bacterium]
MSTTIEPVEIALLNDNAVLPARSAVLRLFADHYRGSLERARELVAVAESAPPAETFTDDIADFEELAAAAVESGIMETDGLAPERASASAAASEDPFASAEGLFSEQVDLGDDPFAFLDEAREAAAGAELDGDAVVSADVGVANEPEVAASAFGTEEPSVELTAEVADEAEDDLDEPTAMMQALELPEDDEVPPGREGVEAVPAEQAEAAPAEAEGGAEATPAAAEGGAEATPTGADDEEAAAMMQALEPPAEGEAVAPVEAAEAAEAAEAEAAAKEPEAAPTEAAAAQPDRPTRRSRRSRRKSTKSKKKPS